MNEKSCYYCFHHDVCKNRNCWLDPNDSSKHTICHHFKTAADVAPRAEVAREIVEDVKATLLDYHLQENKKYLKSLSKTKKQFDIETACYRAITDTIKFAIFILEGTEKKYTEEGE